MSRRPDESDPSPRTRVSPARVTIRAAIKRLLLGRPISTHVELQHRVPKSIGLAVFSSDALSSSAYATDVMLVVLSAAGAAALSTSIPISIAVATVLMIVIFSYRATVRAYPQGGGGYTVAKENLGMGPSVVVGSALLIDYVLTLAVSIAAGVKAIGAAMPVVQGNRVAVALVVVVLITIANLRGVKEAGSFFAIPTYGFLLAMGSMIVIGGIRALSPGFDPPPPPDIEPEVAGLTMFLILRAFSSGATALTGVEAIANAAPNFKPPEDRNAAQTLMFLGIVLAFLFLGITFLSNAYNANPVLSETQGQTVPSQLAAAVFGAGSVMFYVIQFFTALILFLAANTAYAGFPSLAAVLAQDRILPSIFRNRGDKLAYSNGIIILAAVASVVLIIYDADEHKIIPLYVIGVFTDFTISQIGLVRKWLKERGRRWRRDATLNSIGAFTTFVVLIIVSTTKFTQGAWQVIILIPALAFVLYRVAGYYSEISRELRQVRAVPPIEFNRTVLLVSPLFGATLKALGFVRSLAAREVHVIAFRVPERRMRRIRQGWRRLGITLPIEATGHRYDDLVDYIRGLEPTTTRPVTVVLADPQSPGKLTQLRRNRTLLRIKGKLLFEPGVVVVSVPFRPDLEPEPDRVRTPRRVAMIVLVSAVHRATLRALDYAKSLRPAELKAVTIVAAGGDRKIAEEWEEMNLDVSLEVVDSPYRSLVGPLQREIAELGPSPEDAVGVVIPEFVVARWWQNLLHNQTALMLKTALLFQPNVVVINVPYRIGTRQEVEVEGG